MEMVNNSDRLRADFCGWGHSDEYRCLNLFHPVLEESRTGGL